MFPFGACIPSCCNVSLCIFASKSLLMVCLSPPGIVTVFGIKPAQITHVVIREPIYEVERGLRCWLIVTPEQCLRDESWRSLGEEPASSASLSLLHLFLLVGGKWHTVISFTSAPCAASATSVVSVPSAASPYCCRSRLETSCC